MPSDAVKERPILFNGPMVRATLAGTKTQTRRLIEFPSWVERVETVGEWFHGYGHHPDGSCESSRCQHISEGPSIFTLRCPFGVPGDRLWVREAWQALNGGSWDEQRPPRRDACEIRYAATDELAALSVADRGYRWRPSIHMPRWASRITLEVTEVRVQRVQDISEEDAMAEGIEAMHMVRLGENPGTFTSYREGFRAQWDADHGPGAWERNDWVRPVTFRRLVAKLRRLK